MTSDPMPPITPVGPGIHCAGGAMKLWGTKVARTTTNIEKLKYRTLIVKDGKCRNEEERRNGDGGGHGACRLRGRGWRVFSSWEKENMALPISPKGFYSDQ